MIDINLELRMYGMVPYQLCGEQKGIQFGHAIGEYSLDFSPLYQKWCRDWKTVIMLNGGTTNNNPERLGTLNKHVITLREMGFIVYEFSEIDLGDQLLGIAFIVDSRFFDSKEYPNFDKWMEKYHPLGDIKNKDFYEEWLDFIGGQEIYNKRKFLSTFKKA